MFKKFILWLKPTLEDDTGQASYRRMTALVFTVLISYMILADRIKSAFQLNAFYALLASDLLLIGIVTAQNIITFVKGYNSNNSSKQDKDIEIKD